MIQVIIYLRYLIQFYQIMMLIWIVSSFFPQTRDVGFVQWIGRAVEPYFNLFRPIIPSIGGFNISVLVAIWVFDIGTRSLLQILIRFMLP